MSQRNDTFALFERHGESERRIMEGESLEELLEKMGEKAGVRVDPGFDWEGE